MRETLSRSNSMKDAIIGLSSPSLSLIFDNLSQTSGSLLLSLRFLSLSLSLCHPIHILSHHLIFLFLSFLIPLLLLPLFPHSDFFPSQCLDFCQIPVPPVYVIWVASDVGARVAWFLFPEWRNERRESIQRQFHRQWWCVIRSFFFSFLSLSSHLLLYLLLVFVSLSPLFPLPVLFPFSLFSLSLFLSLYLSPLLMFDGTIVLPDNFVLNLILLIVVSRLVITLISSPFSFFFSISFSFSPSLFLLGPFLIPSSFWFPLFHLLVLSFVRPLFLPSILFLCPLRLFLSSHFPCLWHSTDFPFIPRITLTLTFELIISSVLISFCILTVCEEREYRILSSLSLSLSIHVVITNQEAFTHSALLRLILASSSLSFFQPPFFSSFVNFFIMLFSVYFLPLG